MLNQESTIFPKQLKLDDYEQSSEGNLIRILESSNLLLGNGARTSQTAVIMVKCLHFLQDQGIMNFAGKQILELGCGVGLLSVYLGCLGANVIMTDLPPLKELIEKNININRYMLKGELEFGVLNWKKQEQKQEMVEEVVSTSSSDKSYLKENDKVNYTIICEGGNLDDLHLQLEWMGKDGALVGFMERGYDVEEYLSCTILQKYLLEKQYQYEKIDTYHPDYEDQRVSIYRIWK